MIHSLTVNLKFLLFKVLTNSNLVKSQPTVFYNVHSLKAVFLTSMCNAYSPYSKIHVQKILVGWLWSSEATFSFQVAVLASSALLESPS